MQENEGVKQCSRFNDVIDHSGWRLFFLVQPVPMSWSLLIFMFGADLAHFPCRGRIQCQEV